MAWLKSMKNKYVVMNLLKVGVTISCCSHLFACGGDSSNSSKATVNDDGREVGTLAEMGRCTIEREGDTVYVAEKLTDYLCQNNTWIDLSEISDGNNPPDVTPGSSSSISVSSSATSENSESVASSSSLNKEAYSGDSLVVKNRSILGVAQKGPFMFGSPVYLRELTEDSLKYTGMVYEDEISSNKGDFVIPNVSLLSPYACVEVHGQYRNEITGEYSKDSISLFALTDLKTALSDEKNEPRNKVNVNLLTHLEYSRALYLVHKGYSVYAAKKQADQEIMTAFELPTTVKYSEDLSVFEDSQDDNVNYANASLMVLSLLFLGERTDAEITAAIDSFIVDFETDGIWDDAETKTAMADFATEIDISGIRANVKAWNILDIPKFENPLETFWNNVYGLGGCSDKRLNVVAPNSNKLSKNYNKYFICDGSRWNDATTYQKDTYGWSAGKSGEFKKGYVTDTIYVFNGSKWEVSKRETSIGLCGKNNAGVVSKYDGIYYICKNSAWERASMLEYDTYGLTGVEGDVKVGVVNKNKYYVYENGAWRVAANDQEVALGVCTAAREGVVAKDGDTYYICRSKAWTVATALEYDTYGWNAGAEGEVKKGSVTNTYYVFRNNEWNIANSLEISLGSCTAENTGIVIQKGDWYYTCKSNSWTSSTAVERSLGSCTIENSGTAGRTWDGKDYQYYICSNNKWASSWKSDAEDFVGLSCTKDGAIVNGVVNKEKKYVCDNGRFRYATKDEIDLNLGCTSYTRYKIDTVSVTSNSIEKWVCGKKWVYGKTVWGGDLIDPRDNKKYKTVIIDTMTWMAENLNYNYYVSEKAKSYCYKNSADSCTKYGRLYTWSAAMDSAAVFSESGKGCSGEKSRCSQSVNGHIRGVCPEGWHLPSTKEWSNLLDAAKESYRDESASASEYVAVLRAFVKDWETIYDGSYGYGYDTFGFALLPAYYGSVSGYNQGCGFSKGSAFWSYENNIYLYPYARGMTGADLFPNHYGGTCELSVRCMKD